MKRLIKGQLVIWVYKENILGIILSAFFFGGVVACSFEQATEKQLTGISYPRPYHHCCFSGSLWCRKVYNRRCGRYCIYSDFIS